MIVTLIVKVFQLVKRYSGLWYPIFLTAFHRILFWSTWSL